MVTVTQEDSTKRVKLVSDEEALLDVVRTRFAAAEPLRAFAHLVSNERVRKASRIAKETMADYDGSHDFRHVMRVTSTALRVLAEEAGDRAEPVGEEDALAVLLTALLHDVSDHKYEAKLTLKQAVEACLGSLESTLAKRVLEAVPRISYSAEVRALQSREKQASAELAPRLPLEVACVQDADRLDAIGAIGVARCFAFGGAKGRNLASSRIHFDEKLFNVSSMMKTKAGKLWAIRRDEAMKAFIQELDEDELL